MTFRDSPQPRARLSQRNEDLMPDDTFDRVRSIVVNHLGLDPRRVTLATSLIDDLEVDSLEQIELIMKFEDVFDVMISDRVAETIVTIQDAVNYVERQRRRKTMLWPGQWSVTV
jgi:acyl carrier protein